MNDTAKAQRARERRTGRLADQIARRALGARTGSLRRMRKGAIAEEPRRAIPPAASAHAQPNSAPMNAPTNSPTPDPRLNPELYNPMIGPRVPAGQYDATS